MKYILIPFLFLSTAISAQNTANKVERYKINPAINDEFKKPLLGKVKTMHTAHYFIEYNKYDTIKRKFLIIIILMALIKKEEKFYLSNMICTAI